MRSVGSNFKYFHENHLTKLAHLVQFKRVLIPCLKDWMRSGPWVAPWAPRFGYATDMAYVCGSIAFEAMSFLTKLRGGGGGKHSKQPPVAAVEISGPCDMRHEIHVSWDDDGVLQGLPESWKLWMKSANIRYLKMFTRPPTCCLKRGFPPTQCLHATQQTTIMAIFESFYVTR